MSIKKNLLAICCGLVIGMVAVVSIAATTSNKEESFRLVHWNVLKQTYQIGEYLYYHPQTLKELKSDPKFLSFINTTFTPDSYAAVFDQNTVIYLHPNKTLIGKKMTEIKNIEVLRLMEKAIKDDSCVRGFYIWIDKQEKYMVVCPMIGKTKDGYKLYYAYTMYIRSIPDYYVKTLKESVMD